MKSYLLGLLLLGLPYLGRSGHIPVGNDWLEGKSAPAVVGLGLPWVDGDVIASVGSPGHSGVIDPLEKVTPQNPGREREAIQLTKSTTGSPDRDQAVPGIAKTTQANPSPEPISAAPTLESTQEESAFPISIGLRDEPPTALNIREQYRGLAGTRGTFHDATDREIDAVLPEIIARDLPDHSDVVIITDHTSSMGDDIEILQQTLRDLKVKLAAKPGIRIGAVTYSDLKNRPRIGYRSLGLSQNLEALDKFLGETPLIGSIEDMYGAIAKTMKEFNWRSGVPRTIIVISDEAPALPPDSHYTEAQVRQLCEQTQPPTTLHTILLQKD